jgi:glycine oxidase
VGYERTGTLCLLPEEKVALTPTWADVWRSKGYSIEVLSSEETYAREPLLSPGIAGAVYIADEGQVIPVLLMRAYAQAARNLGALLQEHTEVVNIQRDGAEQKVTGVWTAQGDFLACNHLVVAAGAWSAQFGAQLGIALPIRPVRGELVAVRPPLSMPIHHILFDEGLVDLDFYTAPKPDGTVLLGATKAEVGFDTTVSSGGLLHLLDVATRLLPALADWPIERSWAGLRPKTSDSQPFLGPVPWWKNVTIASGHAGFGITLSAITGEMIAESILTGHVPEIILPFLPESHRLGRV